MNFQEKINQDLKEAMKAKDEKALRGIRAIKANNREKTLPPSSEMRSLSSNDICPLSLMKPNYVASFRRSSLPQELWMQRTWAR